MKLIINITMGFKYFYVLILMNIFYNYYINNNFYLLLMDKILNLNITNDILI